MAYEKAEDAYKQCGKACKEHCYTEERKEQENERKLRKYYTEKEAKANFNSMAEERRYLASKAVSKSMQKRIDIQKDSGK